MLWWLFGLGLIVIIIVVGILFNHIKEMLNVLVMLAIIASIVILALGILVIMDARDFQERFNSSTKKYVLVEDNTVLAGLELKGMSEITFYEKPELDKVQESVTARDYEKIRGNDYKIFIFDMLAFESALENPLPIPGMDVSLDKTEVIQLLTGPEGSKVLSRKLYSSLDETMRSQITFEDFHAGMMQKIGSEEKLKGIIMTNLVETSITDDYLQFLMDGIRKGHIRVYPETIMFITIKVVPTGLVSRIMK